MSIIASYALKNVTTIFIGYPSPCAAAAAAGYVLVTGINYMVLSGQAGNTIPHENMKHSMDLVSTQIGKLLEGGKECVLPMTEGLKSCMQITTEGCSGLLAFFKHKVADFISNCQFAVETSLRAGKKNKVLCQERMDRLEEQQDFDESVRSMGRFVVPHLRPQMALDDLLGSLMFRLGIPKPEIFKFGQTYAGAAPSGMVGSTKFHREL